MSMFGMGGQQQQMAPPDPTMSYVNYFPPANIASATTGSTADPNQPIPTLVSPILQQSLPNVLQSPAQPTEDLTKGKTNVGVGPNGMSIGV